MPAPSRQKMVSSKFVFGGLHFGAGFPCKIRSQNGVHLQFALTPLGRKVVPHCGTTIRPAEIGDFRPDAKTQKQEHRQTR